MNAEKLEVEDGLIGKAIQYSVVLVISLGLINGAFIMRAPNSISSPVEAGIRVRGPASDSSYRERLEKPDLIVDIEIECQPSQRQVVADGIKRVRLYFKDCGQNQSAGSNEFRLLNSTNGFTGNMFYIEGNRWTSDYVDLSDGANRVQLLITEGEKSIHHQEIFFVRPEPLRTPAAN